MQGATLLVISDPPHGEVSAAAAATALGAPVEEVRLKLGFDAPEILAATGADRAQDLAGALRAARVSVAVRDGEDLARVPWPALVSWFEFAPEGLRARVEGEDLEILYDAALFGVHCTPPGDFSPPSMAWSGEPDAPPGLSVAEALEWSAHLDLYADVGGALRRVSIAQDLTDFGGIGGHPPPDARAMASAVSECLRRFPRLRLDDRLEGVRPRRRFVAGEAGFDPDKRRRYAFGTLLLRHVLESISGDLRDLTQYELGSRLAYVLSHGAEVG